MPKKKNESATMDEEESNKEKWKRLASPHAKALLLKLPLPLQRHYLRQLFWLSHCQLIRDEYDETAWRVLRMKQDIELETHGGENRCAIPELPARTDIAPSIQDLWDDLLKPHKNRSVYQRPF